MTFMMRAGSVAIRRLRFTLVALLAVATSPAWAHQDPATCSGTAVDFQFNAYRADGSGLDGFSPSECETITYQITIGKSNIGTPCAFEGGTMKITTPDGVIHNVTPGSGVPCIGGTGTCTTTQFSSLTVTYTVSPADVFGGQITATGQYNAAFSHTGASHTLNSPNAGGFIVNNVTFCPASTDCLDSFCDPNLYDSATGALGNCTTSNVPDSTPCTDSDGNQCTFAGCNGNGSCDQNHLVTTCPSDGNPCTDDLGCDSTSGACIYAPTAASTPCPNTDTNLCTTAGCDGFGSCDQQHIVNVCPPDGNECTNDLGCDSTTGACVYAPVPDSTPCTDTDGLGCTTAGCEVGVCTQTHVDSCPVLDHFVCYEVHREPFSGPTVTLADALGSGSALLQRPERLCAPANKNGEDPTAPSHPEHLVGYKVRHATTPAANQRIVDQFNPNGLHLDITKADRLMVPSTKSFSGPAPALPNPVNDHFQCYKVKRSAGFPPFAQRTVQTVDQFGGPITLSVKKAQRLCLPVDKNGEDPNAPSHVDDLMCYKVARTPFGTFFPSINNQFGLRNIELIHRVELCVPALRNP